MDKGHPDNSSSNSPSSNSISTVELYTRGEGERARGLSPCTLSGLLETASMFAMM